MASNKRRRSSPAPLPALTITTRSSARRQSLLSDSERMDPLSKSSSHSTKLFKPSSSRPSSSSSSSSSSLSSSTPARSLRSRSSKSVAPPSSSHSPMRETPALPLPNNSQPTVPSNRRTSRPATTRVPFIERHSSNKRSKVSKITLIPPQKPQHQSKEPEESSHDDSDSEAPSDYESSTEEVSFKRLKFEPLHIPLTIDNLHNADEDASEYEADEDDLEDAPQFNYESKYDDDSLPNSSEYDHSEESSRLADLEMPMPREVLDFVSEVCLDKMTQMDDTIPLVTSSSLTGKVSSFERLLYPNYAPAVQARWPIEKQDESTSFSVLVKSKKNPDSKPTLTSVSLEVSKSPAPTASLNDTTSSSLDPDSLEDYFNYESASSLIDDDSDTASSCPESTVSSPSPEFSIDVSSPSVDSVIFWSDKYANIPICGYRNRNKQLEYPVAVAPNRRKLFAAYNSLSSESSTSQSKNLDGQRNKETLATAYYQQALAAAVGLNRRSLWSGKAREMVGVGFVSPEEGL